MAFSGVSMSPLAITGMRTRGLHRGDGVVLGLAACSRRRACGRGRQAARMPRSRRCAATRSALRLRGSQPVRILSVTGTSTARDHGLEDAPDQRLVSQQRRAGHHVAHLLGRAAHVDVDDLRAVVDVVARRLGHHAPDRRRRSAPRSGRLRPSWLARAARFARAAQFRAGHHLGHRQAGADALAQLRNGRSVTPAIGATNRLRSTCAPSCISAFSWVRCEGSEF